MPDATMLKDFIALSQTLTGVQPLDRALVQQYLDRCLTNANIGGWLPQLIATFKDIVAKGSGDGVIKTRIVPHCHLPVAAPGAMGRTVLVFAVSMLIGSYPVRQAFVAAPSGTVATVAHEASVARVGNASADITPSTQATPNAKGSRRNNLNTRSDW